MEPSVAAELTGAFVKHIGATLADLKSADLSDIEVEIFDHKRGILSEKLTDLESRRQDRVVLEKRNKLADLSSRGLANSSMVDSFNRAIENDANTLLADARREYNRAIEEIAILERRALDRNRTSAGGSQQMKEGYDTAQICLNGHVIAAMAASSPQFQQSFCDKCGEETIMECPECKDTIRGHYHVPGVVGGYDYDLAHFCHNCGKPFPWTTRTLAAASELAKNELSEDESEEFDRNLGEIVRETPQAKASASRIKTLLGKMAAGTAKSVREIIVDVASESAKKMLWP